MDKIKKTLYNLASSESDMANEAYEVYELLENADEREVAEYIATHDADMRRLLGVKSLAEEGADTELGEQYFDLYTKGKSLLNPDPYKRTDYYGDEIKDVDHYMELLGVSKQGGSYTNDQRADFTNPESDNYYGKYDRDFLQGRAMKELGNKATADDLINIMNRMGDAYRYNREQRGYSADNSVNLKDWLTDAGEEFFAPRMREARLAGREWGWNDLIGDAVELGLNFVPGVGVFNRAGKLVARMPKGMQIPTKLIGEAVESSAVPLGSQAYDVFAYDENDPRGQWEWGRVGAQYGGAIGAKGAIKMGAKTAKDAANFAGGKANEGGVKKILDVAEDIGYDTENALRNRGLALERQKELATSPAYIDRGRLTAAQNESGFFGGPEHVKQFNDFEIRKAEAERLARSQKAREALDLAEQEYEQAFQDFANTELSSGLMEQEANRMNAELAAKREAALARRNEARAKLEKARSDFEQVNSSDRDIVQLDDGSFAYNEGGVVGGNGFGRWSLNDNISVDVPSNVKVLDQYDGHRYGNTPSTVKPAEGQTVTHADRDVAVRKAIKDDRDFNAIASGRVKYQKPINTATNIAFNAGAREGIVGQGLDLDSKRRSALWNQQLTELRPYVSEAKGISPKEKKARVDAIMNVLSYGGLDNLPEEVYQKDANRYDEIANILGMRGWMHWSSPKARVNDVPTPSYSTYVPESSSSN